MSSDGSFLCIGVVAPCGTGRCRAPPSGPSSDQGVCIPLRAGEGKWQLVHLACTLCVAAHGHLCDPEIKQ